MPKVTKNDINIMTDKYLKGDCLQSIANDLQLNIKTISYHLEKLKLHIRKPRLKIEEILLISDLYDDGFRIKHIAEQFNITVSTVGKYLKKAGIKVVYPKNRDSKHWAAEKRGNEYTDKRGFVCLRTVRDEKGRPKRKHVYTAEQHFGKKAMKGLIVHHKDFIRSNNDISNLELMTQSNHMKLHMKRIAQIKKGEKLCAESTYVSEKAM